MMDPIMAGAGMERLAAGVDGWSLFLTPLVVWGIYRMRSPKTALRGNRWSMLAMAGFVAWVVLRTDVGRAPGLWAWAALGAGVGAFWAGRVRMIRMPELIALFNGIGGAASALVALVVVLPVEPAPPGRLRLAAFLAMGIGTLTCTGSAVAVLKLSRILNSAPRFFPGQNIVRGLLSVLLLFAVAVGVATTGPALFWAAGLTVWAGLALGWAAMMRVGGADMPVSISLLNALTGVAAAVAGYAVGQPVPVAVGAIVGAGGVMLTVLMCRAMNRRLRDVLGGRLGTGSAEPQAGREDKPPGTSPQAGPPAASADPVDLLRQARRIAIVPGYGMALAQAQQSVRRLYDRLGKLGKDVCFAVHPVAGRMPGHMHVLLAEVDLPYERFREMDDINPEFPDIDVALIVGANDVVNPSASTAEGTPIFGMPVLHADHARAVIVCNLDDRPGYAGVPNPLFTLPHTVLCLGDAAETLTRLTEALGEPA